MIELLHNLRGIHPGPPPPAAAVVVVVGASVVAGGQHWRKN